MKIVQGDGMFHDRLSPQEAEREADRHARMLEEIYIDREELDPHHCPPDRRYFKHGKEAWVYDHGKVAELIYVRVDEVWD